MPAKFECPTGCEKSIDQGCAKSGSTENEPCDGISNGGYAEYTECTDDTVKKEGYNSESQNLFSASTKDDAKSQCEQKCDAENEEQTCAAYLLHIMVRYKCELYEQGYIPKSAGSDNTQELCKKGTGYVNYA